jgi:mannose-1-phosphate guanylyltransferase
MITVIIAGGSGTRLWPLSTHQYPKHLLKLVDDESLLQATYRRAKRLSKSIYVVTGADHIQHIREQLPDLGDDAFIIEPDRRDTAGCFVEALHHIQSRHDHDEPIAFSSADHYIRDTEGFARSFKIAQNVSKERGNIVLIGIEPTYPATGLGYIQKHSEPGDGTLAYDVVTFKEKPDFEAAQQYLQSGNYLWNAGYFVGSVNTFLRSMEQFAPELRQNYDKLLAADGREAYEKTFLSFNKISIDYALMEKAEGLLVVPASFDWMDLGSFADAHKAAKTDKIGNFSKGYVELESVENSYILNQEEKPVAVIGLDNIVVVNTPDGILVARKDLSQQVKNIAQRVQDK